MRAGLALLFAAAVCVALPRASLAFESDEHQKLGALAFTLALAHYRAMFPLSPDAEPKARHGYYLAQGRAAVASHLARQRKNSLTYGEVVACIDYFLYPAKLLAELEARQALLADEERAPTPKDPAAAFFHDRTRCTEFGGNFVLATHTNHSHFQHGAIVSYRTLHEAAVAMAATTSRLHQALLTNAMADHFLTDLFAPGHILTARDRLSDVYATSIHDTYNVRGASFTPRNMAKLLPIAERLCGRALSPCVLHRDVDKAMLAPEASSGAIGSALASLMAEEPVHLKGDGRLWDREQLKQRLLMLLVQAQSVLDVLVAKNSFDDMSWDDRGNPELPLKASLAFGEYVLRDEKGGFVAARRDVLSPVFGASLSRESMTSGGRAGRNMLGVEVTSGLETAGGGNYTGTLGLMGYQEGSVNGWGPGIRGAYVWPATELAWGWYARWLSYPTHDGDTRKVSYGLRMDSGFSSYFTVFLTVGRDYGTTPEHTLGAGWIVSAGFQAQAPWSRIRTLLPWSSAGR